MTNPKYDYYLVENTYVARYDRETQEAEQLMPDGTWVSSIRTGEIFNGRPLEDEKGALETASFLIARNKKRTAAKSPDTATERNDLLLFGGYFSLAFAVFQISGVFWSPDAIRYFGGPAELSRTRPVVYSLLCIAAAAIVAVLGLYALSGAGKIRRLPLLRTIVTITTLIYLLRGLPLIPQLPIVIRKPGLLRFAAFSVISLCVGFVHFGGLIKLLKQGHSDIAASNHRR